MTTMGKYRHLTHTTTPDGHFVIAAVDHRTNLLSKLNQYAPSPLDDAAFTAFKQVVVEALAPHVSAVLTDPAYGIGAGIASRAIRGQIGLLSPLEVTDYAQHPSERTMQMIPHWSVEKIKRVGGDGVKLLLPYHPDADSATDKRVVVEQIVAECAAVDLPFFLEPIPYSLDPSQVLSNDERLQVTVTMTTTFSAMGVDVLKLPFPLDHTQSDDEDEWRQACQAVDEVCSVPWALLSAGVDFDTFLRQSTVACQAGASGVIVGRAVWAEAVELQGAERAQFFAHTAPDRMQQLGAVCAQHATPWYDTVDQPSHNPDWYESYQTE